MNTGKIHNAEKKKNLIKKLLDEVKDIEEIMDQRKKVCHESESHSECSDKSIKKKSKKTGSKNKDSDKRHGSRSKECDQHNKSKSRQSSKSHKKKHKTNRSKNQSSDDMSGSENEYLDKHHKKHKSVKINSESKKYDYIDKETKPVDSQLDTFVKYVNQSMKVANNINNDADIDLEKNNNFLYFLTKTNLQALKEKK
jgi:hypothetical protein